MSQHDLVIDNQAFPATRADLNLALQALGSTSSGSSAPATIYAGQLWVDNSGTPHFLNYYDGTDSIPIAAINASTNKAVPYKWPMSAKTSGFTVGIADRFTVFNCTSGTFTVTLTAAATFGDGFIFSVVNSGSGTITIDPDSSETIDGSTTLALTPGQRCIVVCNGTNFQTVAKTSSAGTSFGNTVATKTGAYTVISSDLGALIRASGTAPYTISLTAAATLGNGFIFGIFNASDGAITIDPNSTEQIDGATTLVLAAGDSGIFVCNGSAFFSMVKVKSGTAAAGDIIRLDATAKLPPVDGSQLTNLPSSGGGFIGRQIFTSSGTYTKTSGVTRAVVTVVGGGGNDSGAGGTSSFGSHASATGGAAASGYTGANGGSGSGSGGINIAGQKGGTGYQFPSGGAGTISIGGAGGSSLLGLGGQAGVSSATGGNSGTITNATGYGGGSAAGSASGGCGGGGAYIKYISTGLGSTETVTVGAAGAGTSGAATPGIVIVDEYA